MSFFEFNIALSGLFSAQRGLQVTANNISNAQTEGYSRQVVTQKASTPLGGFSIGMIGTGSEVTKVARERDSYLDLKMWSQNSRLGEYEFKMTQNSLLVGAFGEPSDTGFNKVFNGMFDRIDQLSQEPTAAEKQTGVTESLTSFATYYNEIAGTLLDYREDLNYELETTVNEINRLATNIQNLNKQIFEAEAYGGEASSFRDQRDLCIDKLSKLVNVTVTEKQATDHGNPVYNAKHEPIMETTVLANGQVLVDHYYVNPLKIVEDSDHMSTVEWTNGQGFIMGDDELSGELKGIIDMRDGGGTAIISKSNKKIADLVSDANRYITEIDSATAVIEDSISSAAEKQAAELKRTQAVEKLKAIIEVSEEKTPANASTTSIPAVAETGYKIKLGSYELVKYDGGTHQTLTLSTVDVLGKNTVHVMNGTSDEGLVDVENTRGAIHNYTNIRDEGVTYNGIQYYLTQMDHYVKTFADAMNEAYSKDKDGNVLCIASSISNPTIAASIKFMKTEADGSRRYYKEDGTEVTGIPSDLVGDYKYKLFTYEDGAQVGSIAATFSLESSLKESAANLRPTFDATEQADGSFRTEDQSDGRLWQSIGKLKADKNMFKQGDPSESMIAILTQLGINADEADMYQKSQSTIIDNIQNQRLAVSQVETNEEFANLIKYQQAYQAAAKVMTTIDGIYETTIFKLGNF